MSVDPAEWKIQTLRGQRLERGSAIRQLNQSGLDRAFSSEVETGSRKENASNQESRAPLRFHRRGALGGVDTYRIHRTIAARVTTAL
jgi:hypothetical protein